MNPSTDQVCRKVHDSATVVDLHAHPSLKASLFQRDLSKRHGTQKRFFWPFSVRTSFPLLAEGGIDVLLSAALAVERNIISDIPLLHVMRYVKPSTWRNIFGRSYYEVTTDALDILEAQADRHNQRPGRGRKVRVVRNVHELNSAVSQGASGPIALVHTIEGAHSLEGDLDWNEMRGHPSPAEQAKMLRRLNVFSRRGVALMTLAHHYPNAVTGCCFPFPEGVLKFTRRRRVLDSHDLSLGLTHFGEAVVRRMFEIKMIVDLTHATPKARSQVYKIADELNAESAVVATHVGAYAINPSPYNLEDWEIKWMADHCGLVGIIFKPYWLMPHETALGLNFLSRTLEHVISVGGEDVPAIGTDLDGFTDPPDEIVDSSKLPRLTNRLTSEYFPTVCRKKFSDTIIEKILGGNALRVLRKGWR